MKRLVILALFTLTLFARFDAVATQSCEAFNNMKHTKNSGGIALQKGQKYTVLKKHKGQYLLLIKGQNPAQRWVDDECFLGSAKSNQKPINTKHTKKYQKQIKPVFDKKSEGQSILVLTWHNAFCEKNPKKQECKTDRYKDEGRLVLHGLWPQPRNNTYCNVPKKIISKDKFRQWRSLPNIDIEESTLELMDEYMPGYLSYLHKHEWIKHGTCYSDDPDRYYADALKLTKQVDNSKVGKLFRSHIGKRLTIGRIREAFDKSFGKGAGKKVSMKCDGRLISELWVHLRGKGDDIRELIKRGKEVRSRCRQGTVDAKN